MISLARVIQAIVIFSVALGVVFLVQVRGLVPDYVFDYVAAGWVLFVVDCGLTFLRPRISYALAFVLAVLALASSLPQSVHYAFITSGDVLPAATFILGSAAQFLLVFLVPYFFLKERRGTRPRQGV